MLRRRACKIGPSVVLALSLSLINTLIILVYLGPLSFKNEDPIALNIEEGSKLGSPVVIGAQKVKRISVVNQDQKPKIDIPTEAIKNVSPSSQSTSHFEVLSDWSMKLPVLLHQEDNLDHAQNKINFKHDAVALLGHPPAKKVEIVIGIPTVKRNTMDYLTSTLLHLTKYLNKNETKQCHIVVFTANFESAPNERTAEMIKRQFSNEVASGLIEVIKPDKSFYSKLTNLPALWKDKPDRVIWRSKQCLDYALLFAYCRNLGYYYLQLEDDVSVSQTYFRDIRMFISQKSTTKWSNLQFGTTGFIGMLFRTSDLGRLALFVKMYYWIFPVDILFRHFNDVHLYGNSPADIRRPPLFLHIGHESSLKGQTRKIVGGKDPKITKVNTRKYTDSTNPSAYISTNIEVYEANTIDGPYRTSNLGYFWGKTIQLNDFVVIEFMRAVTLLRVVFETGSDFAVNDILADGKIETTNPSKVGNCDDDGYKALSSSMNNGKIEASANELANVKCVRLTVTKLSLDSQGNKRWMLIKEIAIWTK